MAGRMLACCFFRNLRRSNSSSSANQTIVGVRSDATIILTLNSNQMKKNDQVITLDEPAQALNGRTLVPLRAIAEALNAQVTWVAETNSVDILSKKPEPFSQIARERYPGDEDAPDWMVHYAVREYFESGTSEIPGDIIIQDAYVTKPSDMSAEQWKAIKSYYRDKEAPHFYKPVEGQSWAYESGWSFERYWPLYIPFYTDLDNPEYSDDPTVNFAQDYIEFLLWSLYDNMLADNPNGGNPINLDPVRPKGLKYEPYPQDANAPDWLVRHITETDFCYYTAAYVTRPNAMTPSEWEALKEYWSTRERPKIDGITTQAHSVFPCYVGDYQSAEYKSGNYIQEYFNSYIYSLYNYMYKDLKDGVEDDCMYDIPLKYQGTWDSGDWRTDSLII